ncbi:MAG: DUF1501 domain-containing protein [Myxococcales bacterium]|nr:DUF1501 domain-containing protein [Myxococcales bacterium]
MCNDNKIEFSRRYLFRGALAGVGMLTLAPITRVLGQSLGGRRLVACYLSGGWDVLLGPDTRDPLRTYDGIDLDINRLPGQYQDPIPVMSGGSEVLWGSTMAALVPHAELVTIFRGMNMNTVSHESARLYSHTGLEPDNTLAKGDSLSTIAAATFDDGKLIPNAAINVANFNKSFDNRVTAFQMNDPDEIGQLIGLNRDRLPDYLENLVRTSLDASRSCVSPEYAGRLPEDQMQLSRDRLKRIQDQDLISRFDLRGGSEEAQNIQALYNVNDGAGEAAATAAQLLRTDLSTAVTARLSGGFDTHGNNWANDQPDRLRRSFDAVGALVSHLREDDPNFDRTTVVVYSEFSRTPRINGNGGRDHWFNDSIVVIGNTLRSGVFGASNDQDLGIISVDQSTGLPNESGIQLKPEMVLGTLVKSIGADPFDFRDITLDDWIINQEVQP